MYILIEKSVDVKCSSWNWMYAECSLHFSIIDINVKRIYSIAECIKDKTFGISTDRKSIWVDDGCRAMFSVTLENHSK